MSVFIEAQTEPFERERQNMVHQLYARHEQPVRRPLRGVQIKENTYAMIRVMGADGQFMPVIDAAGETHVERDGMNYTTYYTNFLVQAVQEERHEKQQIVDTFGESFIFFFGEAPRMLRVSGLLLNTADFNWRAEFWANYERYFRGTRLVEMGARLYLIYDDAIVEGYMVEASAQENANQPNVIPFSFQMFVTGYTDLSLLGDPNFPSPVGGVDYTSMDSYSRAIQLWQQNRNLQRELSTEAVLTANRSAYLGHAAMISTQIRDTIITVSDPSVAGFMARAVQALQTAALVKSTVRSYLPSGQPAVPNPRSEPIRSEFTNNRDEFLEGLDPSPSAQELASPLSMADAWLKADRNVDLGLGAMLSVGTTVAAFPSPQPYDLPSPVETRKFWDLMGRAGRAQSEIKERGGYRSQGRRASGMAIGSGGPARPPVFARDVPFGMMTDPAELL